MQQSNLTLDPSPAYPKQILVIDDEPRICKTVQITLEATTRWTVNTASSGEEGIALAAQINPDVILLDLMMPNMDGLAVFQHLQEKQETCHIPVILLTAKLRHGEQQQFRHMGFQAVLAKPFNPMLFANSIATAIGWSGEDLSG